MCPFLPVDPGDEDLALVVVAEQPPDHPQYSPSLSAISHTCVKYFPDFTSYQLQHLWCDTEQLTSLQKI